MSRGGCRKSDTSSTSDFFSRIIKRAHDPKIEQMFLDLLRENNEPDETCRVFDYRDCELLIVLSEATPVKGENVVDPVDLCRF